MHRAFEALYGEHHDAVLRYFLHKTNSREDAEDLTSHVFEKAWRGYGRFEDRGKRAHWLARISRNVLIDHWRRERPSTALLDEITIVDEGVDLHRHAHLRELRRRVLRAVHRLTPVQRDVVIYRWIHELSIVETAEAMGMTSMAVRAAQQRAFANLRLSLAAA